MSEITFRFCIQIILVVHPSTCLGNRRKFLNALPKKYECHWLELIVFYSHDPANAIHYFIQLWNSIAKYNEPYWESWRTDSNTSLAPWLLYEKESNFWMKQLCCQLWPASCWKSFIRIWCLAKLDCLKSAEMYFFSCHFTKFHKSYYSNGCLQIFNKCKLGIVLLSIILSIILIIIYFYCRFFPKLVVKIQHIIFLGYLWAGSSNWLPVQVGWIITTVVWDSNQYECLLWMMALVIQHICRLPNWEMFLLKFWRWKEVVKGKW